LNSIDRCAGALARVGELSGHARRNANMRT
jgi:hypothetical protein